MSVGARQPAGRPGAGPAPFPAAATVDGASARSLADGAPTVDPSPASRHATTGDVVDASSGDVCGRPSWPRLVWRSARLLAALAVHGGALGVRLAYGRRDDAVGRFLAGLCTSLGGAFIKLGQLLSTRADLLPPALIARLADLRDRVPPFAARLPADARPLIGDALAAALVELGPEPVAAASVAQVHRGRLADGRVVAVKLRRPAVAADIAADLWLVRSAGRLVARLPPLRDVPLEALLGEVGTSIARQVDLRREARLGERLRRAFAARPDLCIPAVVPELSSERCLVMDFIDDLVPLDQAALGPAARERAAVSACQLLFHMAFVTGTVHCDLHPGNLFVRPSGELVLLDFGFVCELDDVDRRAFTDFFLGFASGDGRRCARILVDTALALPPDFAASGRAPFDADMEALIARHHARCAAEFEVARFAVELFDLQRRHRVVGATAFTMTIIAFLVLEGVVKTLHPTMDFQAEARRFFGG